MMSEYILDSLSQGGYFVVNKRLLKEFGGTNTIILGLLIDKFKHAKFEEFFYTGDKLEEDSSFDIRTIRKSLDFWKQKGVLLCEKRGIPCKTYYSINTTKLNEIILSVYAKTSECTNDTNSKCKNVSTSECTNDISNNIKTESIKSFNKNIIPPISPQRESESEKAQTSKASEYTEEFEKFWSEYPRKLNKKLAFKAWNTCLKAKVNAELLISKAKEYAQIVKARGTQEQYIKHAQSWLNGGCYENDYTALLNQQDKQRQAVMQRGLSNWGSNDDDGFF